MRLTVLLLVLLAACESDRAKYERLSQEAAVAHLIVQSDERARENGQPVCPDLVKLPTNAYKDSCDKRVYSHQTDYVLKQRELDRFMEK